MNKLSEGGCFCGSVRYSFEHDEYPSSNCHCSMCRSISGAAFVSWIAVPKDRFKYTKGKPKKLESSSHGSRYFCEECGTSIGTKSPKRPGSMIIKVGTFDDPSVFRADIAIFTKDKQPFHHIDENVKTFERRP